MLQIGPPQRTDQREEFSSVEELAINFIHQISILIGTVANQIKTLISLFPSLK
jgi:hypothetical protein